MTTKNWVKNLKINLKNAIIKFPFPKFHKVQDKLQSSSKQIFYLDVNLNPCQIKDEKDYKYFIQNYNTDYLIIINEEQLYKLLENSNNNQGKKLPKTSNFSDALNSNLYEMPQKLSFSIQTNSKTLSFVRKSSEDIAIIDYETLSKTSNIYHLNYTVVNNSSTTFPKGCYVKFLKDKSSISLSINEQVINPNDEIYPEQLLSFQIEIVFNSNMKYPNKMYLICFTIFEPFLKEQISPVYYQKIITKEKEEPPQKKMYEIDQKFQLSDKTKQDNVIDSSDGYIDANDSNKLGFDEQTIPKEKNKKMIGESSINDENEISDAIIESLYLQLENRYSISNCFDKEFIIQIIKEKKGNTQSIEKELCIRII